MSSQDKWIKIIEKARKGGWKYPFFKLYSWEVDSNVPAIWFYDKKAKNGDTSLFAKTFQEFIFEHSFAKAFWGEESLSITDKSTLERMYPIVWWGPAWQVHLMRMVIQKDP